MKQGKLLIFLALILLFVTPLEAGAIEQQYVTTVYSEQNGLPTGEANVVCQTRDHYVWIGSYGGLVRYDGTTFRNYSQEGKIASASIRSILEDREGRLWVGTNDSGLFLLEGDAFVSIPEQGERQFLGIRDLVQSSDGVVYAASSSGLAYVEGGVLLPVEDPLLSGQIVYTLGADKFGRVWAALNDWQCAVVQGNEKIDVVSSGDIFPEGQQIYAVASDKDGNIYLGTYQNIVAKVQFKDETWNIDNFELSFIETGDITIHNHLMVSDAGDVMVCGQVGFALIEASGKLHTFGEDKSATAVNFAMIDYEGNIWLASSAHGVIKYTKGCFETPNQQAGLEGVSLNTVAMQQGRFYLGLDSGLMIFDENWQPIENGLTESLKGVRIRHIVPTADGCVWLATYSAHGTVCYNPADESCVYYNEDSGMENCWTRTLLPLKDGHIAAGTSNGLYLLKDGQPKASYGYEDGLANTTILSLAEDEKGTLYIGTDGGGMYTLKDGILVHHGQEEGMPEGIVLRLLWDKEMGGLFVGGGSNLYFWKENAYQSLNRFEKAAGSIFDIFLRDGKVWLMQDSGLLAIDKAKLMAGEDVKPEYYSFRHGLTGSLNANTWHFHEPDGSLYLATRSGISIFDFHEMDQQLPSGIINALEVDGQMIEHPAEVTLPADARRMTLHFAMLSYTDTAEYAMAYYLEGLDREESLLTDAKSGSISYTNLPGGDYVFHMRIFEPDVPGQEHHYQVHIQKEKKLTERVIFWVGICMGGTILLATIITFIGHLRHKAHLRRMQERQKELQAILVQSLQAFARIIDAKDRYTNGHSMRVAQYSRELAARMGMSKQEQERIYYIALLHDIGKIGIPDHILNKQGELNKEERTVIQTHPDVGGHVLGDFTALDGIADGARYHHERYDGTGYCEGKAGEQIPLVARIIGVADSYDAMSSDRCYRPALTKEKIISELKEHSGTQFDPQIVPYMLQMIEDNVVPAKGKDTWENAIGT